jgi:hypothetical protein
MRLPANVGLCQAGACAIWYEAVLPVDGPLAEEWS